MAMTVKKVPNWGGEERHTKQPHVKSCRSLQPTHLCSVTMTMKVTDETFPVRPYQKRILQFASDLMSRRENFQTHYLLR